MNKPNDFMCIIYYKKNFNFTWEYKYIYIKLYIDQFIQLNEICGGTNE